MPNYLERMIRRDMEGAQTWQKVAGWVLIILGGGVLVGVTLVVLASVFNVGPLPSLGVGARIFMGLVILPPIVLFDFWLLRNVIHYRQTRKWQAEYERRNPLPYPTEEDNRQD